MIINDKSSMMNKLIKFYRFCFLENYDKYIGQQPSQLHSHMHG